MESTQSWYILIIGRISSFQIRNVFESTAFPGDVETFVSLKTVLRLSGVRGGDIIGRLNPLIVGEALDVLRLLTMNLVGDV